jgi:hypothetical protein
MQNAVIGAKVHLQIMNLKQRLWIGLIDLHHNDSHDPARIKRIAQTVADIINGQHRDKNH